MKKKTYLSWSFESKSYISVKTKRFLELRRTRLTVQIDSLLFLKSTFCLKISIESFDIIFMIKEASILRLCFVLFKSVEENFFWVTWYFLRYVSEDRHDIYHHSNYKTRTNSQAYYSGHELGRTKINIVATILETWFLYTRLISLILHFIYA